jgi:hypothetical protein
MVFMSKQGKDELSIMNNIKDCDPFLQAKVWLKLARTSTHVTKQYNAFSNAIEVLKKEDSVAIVSILIEFSEWLLRNKYDVKVVRENLLMGSDILLAIEEDPADNEDVDGDQVTVFSRSSRGKKSVFSKVSGVDGSRKKDGAGSMKGTDGVGSKQALKGSGNDTRMNKSSKRDVKGFNQENQEFRIAENDEEASTENLNIKHFDQLLRIHSMLAMIAETTESQIQYTLDSKFFMMKILEMTYATLNNMKENTEKIIKEDEKKTMDKDLKERKLLTLPTSLEEWIHFEFPAELLNKVSLSVTPYRFPRTWRAIFSVSSRSSSLS